MPSTVMPLSRGQRLWLAGVLTIAAGLRFEGIDNLSLSHMDEGGYIASAMMVATEGPYSFPYSQALQSPPLLPWIIGGLISLTQAQWPILGVLVSATFGVAAVFLMFLLGRRWGGSPFGLGTATLLAISDFHVAYSRMVLTDVPLTFWFLLTLYCVTRLWERTDQKVLASSTERHGSKKGSLPPPMKFASLRHWQSAVGWGIAAGLAGGAAWNTKYNGWLVLAISLFSASLWSAQRRLADFRVPEDHRKPVSRDGILIGCLWLAGLIATASYAHWYLFVERHFEGGYAAVTANHRGYFYSPASWPRHVQILVGSLAGLRHCGWILAMGLVLGLGWRIVLWSKKSFRTSRKVANPVLSILFVIGLAAVVLIQGADAAVIFLGSVGIVPALLSGRRERLLAAVWCGTFVVLTPLYHPYPRLMLPALPACICLTQWLLQDIWPGLLEPQLPPSVKLSSSSTHSAHPRLLAAGGLVAALCLSLIWLLGPHPLGLFAPTRGVWNRWTTHQSYRAAGEAVIKHTDRNAVIICQSQLAMIAYCERLPLPDDEQTFETLVPEIPADRDCYLIADYYGKSLKGALQKLQDHARDLSPVAIIENDLSIVTLLDQLTPQEVAAKVSEPQPAFTLGDSDPRFPAPPPLGAKYQDVIVLYRIHRPLSK